MINESFLSLTFFHFDYFSALSIRLRVACSGDRKSERVMHDVELRLNRPEVHSRLRGQIL